MDLLFYTSSPDPGLPRVSRASLWATPVPFGAARLRKGSACERRSVSEGAADMTRNSWDWEPLRSLLFPEAKLHRGPRHGLRVA